MKYIFRYSNIKNIKKIWRNTLDYDKNDITIIPIRKIKIDINCFILTKNISIDAFKNDFGLVYNKFIVEK